MDEFNNSYYCYIIHTPHTDRTYNGYTVNLERRLKQHNGLLKGVRERPTTKVLGSTWWS